MHDEHRAPADHPSTPAAVDDPAALTVRRRLRGGTYWVLATVVYFTVEVLAGLAWNGRYDWMQNSISDLGWREPGWVAYPFQDMWADSPLSWLFNGGSVVAGALMMLGAWELRGIWTPGRRPRLARWITGLWITMGLFTILTAVVPGDISLLWHSLLAQPIFFSAPILAMLLTYQIVPAHHHLAVASGCTAVIALIGTIGLLIQLWVRIPFGLMERMALDTSFLWMLVAALTALFQGKAQQPTRTTA